MALAVGTYPETQNIALIVKDISRNVLCSYTLQATLGQLVAAAVYCCSLQQLQLSSTGLGDAELKPLTQSSSWVSQIHRYKQLQQLNLSGNRLSAVAVGQLGRAMATGGDLGALTHLSLAGCASVGDKGGSSIGTPKWT